MKVVKVSSPFVQTIDLESDFFQLLAIHSHFSLINLLKSGRGFPWKTVYIFLLDCGSRNAAVLVLPVCKLFQSSDNFFRFSQAKKLSDYNLQSFLATKVHWKQSNGRDSPSPRYWPWNRTFLANFGGGSTVEATKTTVRPKGPTHKWKTRK